MKRTSKRAKRQSEEVLQRLASFAELERKATDETGCIALVYSCSRADAAAMILEARQCSKGEQLKATTIA